MTEVPEEKKKRAQELRREGKSIRAIAKELALGHGTVQRAVAGIEVSQAEKTKDRLPASSQIPMSQENVDLANRLREVQLESEMIDAEVKRRQNKRRLALLEAEEQLELREQELSLKERQRQLYFVQPAETAAQPSDGDQGQSLVLEEVRKLQQERESLAAEKTRIQEERHELELSSLRDQIADLGARVTGQQTGRTQYDLLSQGMSLLGQEVRELRQGAFDLLNSPNIRARFSPGRIPTDTRRQFGEAVVGALEGERLQRLRCPSCGAEAPVTEKMLAEFPKFACRQCGAVFPNPRQTAPAPAPKEKPGKTGETKEGQL